MKLFLSTWFGNLETVERSAIKILSDTKLLYRPFLTLMRHPMLKFSADLFVNRPLDKVFAWLTNPQNQAKFDTSSLEMELLTSAPWQAGSQFREVRNLGGRKTEVFSEITEFEADRLFVIRSKTGPDWLGTWRFEPEGTGTRLRWTGQMSMKGFARLLEPLIGSQMRPQIDQQFSALPALIESEIP